MVYVLNKDGKPLMPTKRYAKIRILRKRGLLKIVSVKPFIVQLLYDTKNITQDVTLGIDSGYLNIGFSAITEKQELMNTMEVLTLVLVIFSVLTYLDNYQKK